MADIEQFYIALLGIICLVILYSFIGSAFEHYHFHYIHETGVGIIVGAIFGVIVFFLHDFSEFSFNEELFFLALLPAMIFSGGYNLKKKDFFKNIKYILIFGLFGTLVSFFVIFGLTYLINHMELISILGKGETVVLSTALMIKFSATICATDSVAALTLIKYQDHPKLFSVIFGEGMVNDAVAIILFKVLGSVFEQTAQLAVWASQVVNEGNTLDLHTILSIVWQFAYTVIISIAIGGVIALFSTWLFKRFRFLTSPVCQVVIVYLFGILSYLIAEICQMSGVLAVLVAGIVLAHFNFYNMSMTGQVATGITFQSIAFIAEAIVFIYLGLSSVYYIQQYDISLAFFGLELIVCILSRLTAIFGLALLFKICSKWVLTNNQMAIVSTAGTIRGSVAFALILTVEAPSGASEAQEAAVMVIKSTVLFMVFLTTIVLGGAMPWFIKVFLGDQNLKESIKVSFLEQEMERQQKQERKPKSCFKMIDEEYLKPLLIHDYVKRKDEIKNFKKFYKLNSPQYKGAEYVQLFKASIRHSVVNDLEHEKVYKSGHGPSLIQSYN